MRARESVLARSIPRSRLVGDRANRPLVRTDLVMQICRWLSRGRTMDRDTVVQRATCRRRRDAARSGSRIIRASTNPMMSHRKFIRVDLRVNRLWRHDSSAHADALEYLSSDGGRRG